MVILLKHNEVTVRVPATTGNLGSGFDSMGMALTLWNHIKIQHGGPSSVKIHGEGACEIRTDKENLIFKAIGRIFQEAGTPVPEIQIESWQEVPLSRGLGSSACAIVGSMFAANALLDYVIPEQRLLQLAVEMEGHPDQVAAALLGGLCIVVLDGSVPQVAKIPVPDDLQCVVFIPDFKMDTKKARAVLHNQVEREDVVFNIGRASLLVAGLATKHYEYLRLATQDRLHQPAREQVFPGMKQLFRSALNAGALGVFLSGAGSSVVALTSKSERRAMTLGYEMADAADKAGLPGRFLVLEPAANGAEVMNFGGMG
jgi:homoserine kinase